VHWGKSGNLVWWKGNICKKKLRTTVLNAGWWSLGFSNNSCCPSNENGWYLFSFLYAGYCQVLIIEGSRVMFSRDRSNGLARVTRCQLNCVCLSISPIAVHQLKLITGRPNTSQKRVKPFMLTANKHLPQRFNNRATKQITHAILSLYVKTKCNSDVNFW